MHQQAEAWAHRSASVFDPKKYQLVHFMPPELCRNRNSDRDRTDSSLTLTLRDGQAHTIKAVEKAKYLGVTLDNELTGYAHLEEVLKKAVH
jgi:hypothetical protein